MDAAALRKAVAERGIRAGLDVFEKEPAGGTGAFEDDVVKLPGVVGTHHVGASTDQAQNAIAAETVRIVAAFAATGEVPNAVNLASRTPATHLLTVRHRDRVGVLAHVFGVLKAAGINVQQTENVVFAGAEAACARIQVDQGPGPGRARRDPGRVPGRAFREPHGPVSGGGTAIRHNDRYTHVIEALPAKTLVDYFRHAAASGKPDLLVSKIDGAWRPLSAEEFGERTKGLALGLALLGVDRQDRVAILSENRPEWPMTDFATLSLGAMTVPIYTSYLAPQVEYILRDSLAKVVVVSNAIELQKVLDVRDRCPELKHVVVLEQVPWSAGRAVPFETVVQKGLAALAADSEAWEERASSSFRRTSRR